MFPITAITWRLGELDSTSFEALVPDKKQKQIIFEELSNLTGGVYFLETCQRLILVTETDQAWLTDEIINRYFSILDIQENCNFERFKPEVFLGLDGLLYLSKVVSGLDSLVLGESQIQHQFKTAFEESFPYMGSQLKTHLQYIIRVGKRVRSQSHTNRTTTIEAVDTYLNGELEAAESIGIFGTGKMGELILKYYSQHVSKISIYSGHANRIGLEFKGVKVKSIETMQPHDILFTATTRSKYINKEFLNKFGYVDETVIIDLGMPRNCDPEINDLDHIRIVDIERLIQSSNTAERLDSIHNAMQIIEAEVHQIVKDYHQQLRSKSIIELRKELTEFANDKKPEKLSDKQFSQFINALIHISQKHLERAINKEPIMND